MGLTLHWDSITLRLSPGYKDRPSGAEGLGIHWDSIKLLQDEALHGAGSGRGAE